MRKVKNEVMKTTYGAVRKCHATPQCHKQVCRFSLLLDRNVRWPRRMLPLGESRAVCATRSPRVREKDGTNRRSDGRQTVTLRLPLDAASVINKKGNIKQRRGLSAYTTVWWMYALYRV